MALSRTHGSKAGFAREERGSLGLGKGDKWVRRKKRGVEVKGDRKTYHSKNLFLPTPLLEFACRHELHLRPCTRCRFARSLANIFVIRKCRIVEYHGCISLSLIVVTPETSSPLTTDYHLGSLPVTVRTFLSSLSIRSFWRPFPIGASFSKHALSLSDQTVCLELHTDRGSYKYTHTHRYKQKFIESGPVYFREQT